MLHSRTFQNIFFIAMLVLVTLAFFRVLAAYLSPLFWAAVLAVLFFPVQMRLQARLGGRKTLAASLTFMLILAAVIIPTGFIAVTVTNEVQHLLGSMQKGKFDPGAFLQRIESVAPYITAQLAHLGLEVDALQARLSNAMVAISRTLGSYLVTASQSAVNFSIGFLIMLYLLFFALRDGERLLALIIRALPMGDDRERALMTKFAEVTRATIKGTVVIGFLQGALGGIAFALLGIPGAVLWGVIMALLSALPAVGASLVWIPAALFLGMDGRWSAAIGLVVFGVAIIGMVDNLLRPILVGRDTQIPDWLILVSTLGGLSAFGLSGFIIGPVIAALFLTFWALFEREHHADYQAGGTLASWNDQDRPASPIEAEPATSPVSPPSGAESSPEAHGSSEHPDN